MDNAGEPFRPVLVSGKEYDAVTAALLPLLEEMKRHHAERRRRGDRRTRKTAGFVDRAGGAGFPGFLHKFTISFREHLQARRPRALSSSIWRDSVAVLQELKKPRHKQALIDSPRFKATYLCFREKFAGIDLALVLIEEDHGFAIAKEAQSGQAQCHRKAAQ